MTPDTLILASTSPRRKFLLEQMSLRFTSIPAQVTENEDPDSDPKELVLHNAKIKANYVSNIHRSHWVLGSDTTVAYANKVLNKPEDMTQAKQMLRTLSGNTHTVYTGIALVNHTLKKQECHFVTSEVTFKRLDDSDIDEYFKHVNPLDKAGAYGIQEAKELIIQNLNGSLNNVMGLPTEFLEKLLVKMNLLNTLKQ